MAAASWLLDDALRQWSRGRRIGRRDPWCPHIRACGSPATAGRSSIGSRTWTTRCSTSSAPPRPTSCAWRSVTRSRNTGSRPTATSSMCRCSSASAAASTSSPGRRRRAPVWIREVGLEWLHRLVTEPRRLANRYARDFVRFTPLVYRQFRAMRHGAARRTPPTVERVGDTVVLRPAGGLDLWASRCARTGRRIRCEGDRLVVEHESASTGSITRPPLRSSRWAMSCGSRGVSSCSPRCPSAVSPVSWPQLPISWTCCSRLSES